MKRGLDTPGLFVDRDAAHEALRLAAPLLERAAGDAGVGQSGVVYVVVMDPSRPACSCGRSCEFEQAILAEQGFGKPRAEWDADYAGYARAKARLAWRTGRDSHAVRALSPHLLRRDDTPLWGSVCVDGIAVGVSGAEPEFDEALSGAVAMCLRAVVKRRARS
ncbi:MAG TPA: hypothetical protein VI319_01345 [Burkholderiales bacterium]